MKLGYNSKSRNRSEPNNCLKLGYNSKSRDISEPNNCLKPGYNSKSRNISEPNNCLKPLVQDVVCWNLTNNTSSSRCCLLEPDK